MKTLRCVLVLLVFAGLMLVGCSDKSHLPVSPAVQGSLAKESIELTFTSQPAYGHPNILIVGGYMNIAGRTIHLKDFPVTDSVVASNPLMTGKMDHKLSLKLDSVTGEGPCNGKFTLTPSNLALTGGGVWEGIYEGYRSKTNIPFVFTLPLKMVAHGKGGTIDGW